MKFRTVTAAEAKLMLRDLGVTAETPFTALNGRQLSTLRVLARKNDPHGFLLVIQKFAKEAE